MADTERVIEIQVLRYRPEQDTEPVLQSYKVPFTDDMSVLQGLQYIKDYLDGTVSFRWSCRMAICGSCGMMIDGKPVDPAQHAAAVLAWELVACDYGGACGPTSPVLLGACADRGLCGLGSFEDLARVTTQNSNTYSQALEFRAQIRAALQNHDYVSLGLDPARRPKPKG